MNFYKILLISIIILNGSFSEAQDSLWFKVRGHMLDIKSRPLRYLEVYLNRSDGLSFTTRTDSAGYYEFDSTMVKPNLDYSILTKDSITPKEEFSTKDITEPTTFERQTFSPISTGLWLEMDPFVKGDTVFLFKRGLDGVVEALSRFNYYKLKIYHIRDADESYEISVHRMNIILRHLVEGGISPDIIEVDSDDGDILPSGLDFPEDWEGNHNINGIYFWIQYGDP